jgi:hypothetical protein
MNNDWPFDQPPNCAVTSLRDLAENRAPILHVTHDRDDHGWQFLGLEDPREDQAVIVRFSHIVDSDPTIRDRADLPPGWHAWRRSKDEPWIREPNPNDEEETDGP